jgi:hypothetical protein
VGFRVAGSGLHGFRWRLARLPGRYDREMSCIRYLALQHRETPLTERISHA